MKLNMQLLFKTLLVLICVDTHAQGYISYETPVNRTRYSQNLLDTVSYEVIVPKQMGQSPDATYPLIVVFDRQNQIGYRNTINTIDYLTANAAMPSSIIIGISLKDSQRNKWTLPEYRKGKADAFLDFILNELPDENKSLPVNKFMMLIGHSRTAIFSSYALSKRPDRINAIFGASLSDFDFGDEKQKQLFQNALLAIKNSKKDTYYYYSVGGKQNGDSHEESVLQLNSYLEKQVLPENFKWKFFHKKDGNHFTNYGLAIADALNDLFRPYVNTLTECFTILNSSQTVERIPWEEFEKIYEAKSTKLGVDLRPDVVFYNSITSHFSYASNVKEESRTAFGIEVLNRAIADFPNSDNFHSWIAKLYFERGDRKSALGHYKLRQELIEKNNSLSAADKKIRLTAIAEQMKTVESRVK